MVSLSITTLILTMLITLAAAESNPTFTVESTAVKAYNLTASDNRLFCIINLVIRAHNPTNATSYDFKNIIVEVKKGNNSKHHHKLADDVVPSFTLGPTVGDVLIRVEAVGLRVELGREVAAEVRADAAAGEGLVDVFMNGDDFRVTCTNVAVDFSGSTMRVEKVVCEVRVDRPSRVDPAPGNAAWTWSGSTPSPTNGIRY